MPSLFYVRLIAFTAGTLVYLFLLALILGHRRPRLFERLLFFLCLSLFLTYSGGLLEINALVEYGAPPNATRIFYTALIYLGLATLPALALAAELVYVRTILARKLARTWWIILGLFCLLPLAFLSQPASERESALLFGLALASIMTSTLEFFVAKHGRDRNERNFFRWLGGFSLLGLVVLFLRWVLPAQFVATSYDLLTVIVMIGLLPGALLLYYAVRRNFLEFGAQRNLMYALPATFLALLYLALVRRVSGWLEPVMPPEATAAVLLFSLIFLFEPLERVIGPILQERFRQGMSGVQRLSIELQQEARQGNVTRLISEAEGRIREEFGLAAVRITLRPNPALPALEAPGGLGHTATVRLKKDGEEIGLLEAASTGSYLTGETTAALGFLGEQLPGMIDLARLIEDKVRLERELAERERMASLGQMAANVSHNLRNPLSSMKTVLQVQLEDPDLPVNVRRDSTLVVSEIDRMSAKLSQLLRYAKPSVNGQRVAAVALANQTAVLFRHDAERRNVRFEFERPTEEIFALASEEALSEILSNLIVNAIEAQADGGRVKVGLARSNGRLEIVVEDGGPGISQELREKMFQPYFTTKPAGTGLGLSIVARRVEEMGGTISCESPVRNGKGTRFRLKLPLATGEGS